IHSRDFDGKTPLHHAARNGDIRIIHFLIHRGAQPLEDVLHDALMGGMHNTESVVRLLLENGASISSRMKDGSTVLHTFLRKSLRWNCAPAHYLAVALLLIDKGCEVNALDSVGETPLHVAAQLGYIPIVRLLLD
ncbi:ankyrin repeat protein, partial [Melanogaster broomeanus]